jgi:6-pyruvoyltetrahydropterin/6-carboxytetrahydropterin synthase
MLLDFGILKGALRTVLGTLDHSNLNDVADFAGDPSAERIAKYVFDAVERGLPAPEARLLWAVEVFETPTSMARFER